MRKVGLRIADALEHGELAILPEWNKRLERGMKADRIGQLHDLVAMHHPVLTASQSLGVAFQFPDQHPIENRDAL